MSAPFAPSPKLDAYCEWAKEHAGCEVQEGVMGNLPCRKIIAPDGRYVFQTILGAEPLSHSVVAQLDRRLGLDSPFPKTPSWF